MHKILETSQTDGTEFYPNLPFWVRVEGDLSSNSVQLQSKRVDGTIWNIEYTFTGDDKATWGVGAESGEIIFKLVAQTSGVEGWTGIAVPQSYPR